MPGKVESWEFSCVCFQVGNSLLLLRRKSIERTSSTIDPPHKFTFVGWWRELNARRNTALSSQRAEDLRKT